MANNRREFIKKISLAGATVAVSSSAVFSAPGNQYRCPKDYIGAHYDHFSI